MADLPGVIKMPIIHMTWEEKDFQGKLNSGHEEGFVFNVLGPSYIYPSHRQPYAYSPHGCKNANDTHQLVIPIIAAITFERSAGRSHSFDFPGNLDNPLVECMLTTEATPQGKYYQLAKGIYDPPPEARTDERYEDNPATGSKLARLDFAMNEVKAMFLNVSFAFNDDVAFYFGGNYNIWVMYWGFSNYCNITLKGAPDHGALVDMKYQRQPRV